MNLQGLIVGLGNPGKQYDATRHNLGFMAVDALMEAASSLPGGCTTLKQTKTYQLWRCAVGRSGGEWLVLKPLTYMNRSGDAVGPVARYYRIEADQVLVVHDEMDLPLGRMKLKFGGGLAGHNGLKSIAAHLGTQDFHRLRLGIGRADGKAATNHVLGPFSKADKPVLDGVLRAAVEGMETFASEDLAAAVQQVNSFEM